MRQDVEFFQSFVRRYINRTIRNHFSDISSVDESNLNVDVPRQAAKKLCLHKDTDTMTLTIGRLLFWWIETRGLLDEFIYGIPSTHFETTNTYYPQVKLHFKEDRYESSTNNRRPIRSEVSFRWRELDFSESNIRELANKIHNDFARPVFSFDRGRELWSYADKSLGYYFQLKVQNEAEAKKVIEQAINIQDEGIPNWEKYLRYHEDKQNYDVQETVRVMGETVRKPKKRPVGKVTLSLTDKVIQRTTNKL